MGKPKTWITRYRLGGRVWGAWVVASTRSRARELIRLRGLGEVVVGEVVGVVAMLTWKEHRKRRSVLQRLHYLTFLAMVNASAFGRLGATTSLGDVGWFHEWVHQVGGIQGVLSRDEVDGMIYHVEQQLGFTC